MEDTDNRQGGVHIGFNDYQYRGTQKLCKNPLCGRMIYRYQINLQYTNYKIPKISVHNPNGHKRWNEVMYCDMTCHMEGKHFNTLAKKMKALKLTGSQPTAEELCNDIMYI